jgi:Tol biopolymer transport system component
MLAALPNYSRHTLILPEARMIRLRVLICFGALATLIAGALLAAPQAGKTQLDQARARKAAGDLQGATEGFEKVVADFAASDRNAAARALVELGEIFDTLGQDGRARGFYERVRNDFRDQAAEAKIATDRLAQTATRIMQAANSPGAGANRVPSKITIRTPYADDIYGFALSPDGKTLVFQGTSPEGRKMLWRQAVDASQKPEPITGTEGTGANAHPFFSPDGKTIAFFSKQKLWQIDLAGGTPKPLAEAPSVWGASWRGGSIIMSVHVRGQIEALEDGRIRPLTNQTTLLLSPEFIDDRRFIYFVRDGGGRGKLEVGSLDGSPAAANGLPTAQAAAFTQGHLLYVTAEGALNAVPFDTARLAATGAPNLLADRVGRENRLAGIAAFAVSAAGPVAYRETAVTKRRMLWMDRAGALVGTLGSVDDSSMESPRVSPDGRAVLYFRQVGSPMGSVWAVDGETGSQRMLQDSSTTAIWSPGGDRIVLSTLRNGIPTLITRPSNAPDSAGQVVTTSSAAFPDDLAQNGALLYRAGTGQGVGATLRGDLLVILPNQSSPVPVAQTPATERNGRFSPDGAWIAYQSDESGRNEVYIQPFPGTIAQRQRLSLNGGVSPQWGRKGRELYFISADNHLMTATAQTIVNGERRSIEFSTPKPLFNAPLPPGAEYDTALDGDRFLIIAPVEETPPIIVLSNWQATR